MMAPLPQLTGRPGSPLTPRGFLLVLLLSFWLGPILGTPTAMAMERIVPVSTATQLRSAIAAARDGDVIELANGIYQPGGSGPILIQNPGAKFTLRAANPGGAIIDGGNSVRLFEYFVDDAGAPGWVVFQGLVFRNGRTLETGNAGALNLRKARATFVDCTFESNRAVPGATSGASAGAIQITAESRVIFDSCTFTNNTSDNHGGALLVGQGSSAFIVDSQFIGNRNNVPGHRNNGLGGAIHAFNGLEGTTTRLYVSNTLFRNNQAAFVGGAIQARGNFATESQAVASPTVVVVANSTFEDNATSPLPGVEPSLNSPTEGGAIMIENDVVLEIYHSRFRRNSAGLGGAISSNRGAVLVRSSEFRDNHAFGRATAGLESDGLGGAIKAHSNDVCSSATNLPSATVDVADSFFENNRANWGGCIHTAGDQVRQYGTCPSGNLAANRAQLLIERSAFTGCAVDNGGAKSSNALGGAVYTNLTDVTVSGSLFLDSHARVTAPNPVTIAGGAAAFRLNSRIHFFDSTFADNSAEKEGGALHVWGGQIAGFSGNAFLRNTVGGDGGSNAGGSRGAAIYSSPDPSTGGGLDLTGAVDNSVFSDHVGIPVWERDQGSLRNRITYNGNTFHNTTFGNDVFYSLEAPGAFTAAELNGLVVGGIDKSPAGTNAGNGSTIPRAALLAVPPRTLLRTAAGDPPGPSAAYLAWAWSGGCAKLDGSLLDPSTEVSGFSPRSPSTATLAAWDGACSGAADASQGDTITSATPPVASLVASPVAISGGQSSDLTWALGNGTLRAGIVSHDASDSLPSPSGNATVMPPATTRYRLVTITETGSSVDVQGVFVDQLPDEADGSFFSDGFESGDVSAWGG